MGLNYHVACHLSLRAGRVDEMRYLVTGNTAAEIDRYTIEEIGVPQLVLMERAALAVAEEAAAVVKNPKHDRILVAAESGNNGGDGVAAARILHQRGYAVELWTLNGIAKQSEAFRKQTELADKAGVPRVELSSLRESTAGYAVIIDAIFGVGLTREVKGVQREAVEWINLLREREDTFVISVDIPTGISSETGEVLGTAVCADHTVTFGYEKAGMLFAKDHCGRVSVKEIGFYLPEALRKEGLPFFTYDRADIRGLLPKRSSGGNKGSFGHVLVVAGSQDICGAAYLSAEAAYRTGCGLVRVVTHENNREALQKLLPEALLQTYSSISSLGSELTESIRWASVIIIGPGLGRSEETLSLTETVLREAVCPVIADADAINLLAEHTEILSETAGKRPLILTPHMLEMTRLTERSLHPERDKLEELKKKRVEIAKKTAEQYQAVVVLKDACTVVTEGNETYLNSSGCDAMAKGGSGDVLTGVIAGLIAQGMQAREAARLGVYMHGLAGEAAAERLGSYSVLAGDLMAELPDIIRDQKVRD